MSLSALVLGATLASGATPVGSPSSATAAATSQSPAFSGKFRFTGGQRERDSVVDAVERAVEALLPIFHGLARKRLTQANIVPTRVSMTMKGDELEIIYGDLEPMRAPLDGSIRDWHNREGHRVNLKLEMRGNRLVQTTWGAGGSRIMRWTVHNDGRRLRLHSTMSSPRMPVSVDYRLTFRP